MKAFRQDVELKPVIKDTAMFKGKKSVFAALLASSALMSSAQVSNVWSPDLGNGEYKNPVINADYSDPDVVRVGDDYYMTASSFCDIPGLPVLHSKDCLLYTSRCV